MGLKYIKGVATLKLDSEKCIGCGICLNVCPHAVFIVKDKKAYIADKDMCMECGACAMNCPVSALEVKSGTGCAYAIIDTVLFGAGSGCS